MQHQEGIVHINGECFVLLPLVEYEALGQCWEELEALAPTVYLDENRDKRDWIERIENEGMKVVDKYRKGILAYKNRKISGTL